MASDKGVIEKMDKAAADAGAELTLNLEKWTARGLIDWWARWYERAGYTRLGKILVGLAKKDSNASKVTKK